MKLKTRILELIPYLYLMICSGVMILPFIVTFSRSIMIRQPDGSTIYTFDHYGRIMPGFWEKLRTSSIISLLTIVIDALIGIPTAYALVRYDFKGKSVLFTFLTGVWYIPGIAYAMALVLSYYFVFRFLLGFWGYVAAYSCGFLFLTLMTCIVAFRHLDPCYEEAALCLGANKLKAFLRVTLPLIGPGLSAGILLTFILSFNEFVTALLLSGPTRLMTAPLQVWADIRSYGVRAMVAAEAVILQGVALIAVIAYFKFIGARYLKGTVLI